MVLDGKSWDRQINLMVANKVRGLPKSLGLIIWGPSMSVQDLIAVHAIVVEIFSLNQTSYINIPSEAVSIRLPKLWNRCFSLRAHFGISLRAAPSASQMSEVKHVISEVGRHLPLCPITWYLLRVPVNKHRCTLCGWGCSLNAIVPWWVQFLPPQRMNLYRWRKLSVQDNERTVFYTLECGK